MNSASPADRKSTRLNSSHDQISYAVFCLKKKKKQQEHISVFYNTIPRVVPLSFFFFNDTATTEIYTLSLHDALPIYFDEDIHAVYQFNQQALAPLQNFDTGTISGAAFARMTVAPTDEFRVSGRSEEHTSELQSRSDLVCRLLLEKKKKTTRTHLSFLQYYPSRRSAFIFFF